MITLIISKTRLSSSISANMTQKSLVKPMSNEELIKRLRGYANDESLQLDNPPLAAELKAAADALQWADKHIVRQKIYIDDLTNDMERAMRRPKP